MNDTRPKWQPVILVLNRRMECACGSMAVFVTGQIPQDEDYNILEEVDAWCQDCFTTAQEAEQSHE